MKAGDTLDFIVDIGDGLNSDQFLWRTNSGIGQLRRRRACGVRGLGCQKDFAAPPRRSHSTPWEQLAQTLMLTNEFMFID